MDNGVCPSARVKARVQAAIAVKPRNAIASRAVVASEPPADEHLAVALQGDGVDPVVCASAGIKGRIESSIAVKPRNPVASRPLVTAEPAANKHLRVTLHRGGPK